MADFRGAHEYSPSLDYKVAGFDIPEQSRSGFEQDGARAVQVGHQFTSDFRRADAQGFGPAKVVARWHQQPACGEAALDPGGGVDFERALSHNLPNKPPFDDRLADPRVRVEHISLFFDHQPAISAEVFGSSLVDVIIAQIHVAAAALAHGGFSRRGHFQRGPALEADDPPLFNGRLALRGGSMEDFFQPA